MTSGLKLNKQKFWLLSYLGREDIYDDWLNKTGEYKNIYSQAVECYANISPASGYSQTEMFGNLDSYDKVISPLPADFPISENDVLFIDKAPEYEDGNPLFDYVIRRIARSLNYTSVAVRKVNHD